MHYCKALLLLYFSAFAEAMHFNGGTIRWIPLDPYTNSSLVNIGIQQLYWWTYPYVQCNVNVPISTSGFSNANINLTCEGDCSTDGGYSSTPIDIITDCLSYSSLLNTMKSYRSKNISLSSSAHFHLAYRGNPWIGLGDPPITNLQWSLVTLINLSKRPDGFINTPPVVTVVSPQYAVVNKTTQIKISAFDVNTGDDVRCRWSQYTAGYRRRKRSDIEQFPKHPIDDRRRKQTNDVQDVTHLRQKVSCGGGCGTNCQFGCSCSCIACTAADCAGATCNTSTGCDPTTTTAATTTGVTTITAATTTGATTATGATTVTAATTTGATTATGATTVTAATTTGATTATGATTVTAATTTGATTATGATTVTAATTTGATTATGATTVTAATTTGATTATGATTVTAATTIGVTTVAASTTNSTITTNDTTTDSTTSTTGATGMTTILNVTTLETFGTLKSTSSYPVQQALDECGDICYPNSVPNDTILSNCTITFTPKKAGIWYAIAIQVEDFLNQTSLTPMSSVPVQLLIYVQPEPVCPNKPIILPLTGCLELQVSVVVSFNLTMINLCNQSLVTLAEVVISTGITGMTYNNLSTSLINSSVSYMQFTWVPHISQVGLQQLCVTVYTSENVQSDEYCVVFTVKNSSILCTTIANTTTTRGTKRASGTSINIPLILGTSLIVSMAGLLLIMAGIFYRCFWMSTQLRQQQKVKADDVIPYILPSKCTSHSMEILPVNNTRLSVIKGSFFDNTIHSQEVGQNMGWINSYKNQENSHCSDRLTDLGEYQASSVISVKRIPRIELRTLNEPENMNEVSSIFLDSDDHIGKTGYSTATLRTGVAVSHISKQELLNSSNSINHQKRSLHKPSPVDPSEFNKVKVIKIPQAELKIKQSNRTPCTDDMSRNKSNNNPIGIKPLANNLKEPSTTLKKRFATNLK